jgi:hypothetical protein
MDYKKNVEFGSGRRQVGQIHTRQSMVPVIPTVLLRSLRGADEARTPVRGLVQRDGTRRIRVATRRIG